MFYLKKQIRGDVMEKIYIIDDTLEIPEEIRNLSEEEMDRQIAILEEAGRREGKNLPDPILLSSNHKTSD